MLEKDADFVWSRSIVWSRKGVSRVVAGLVASNGSAGWNVCVVSSHRLSVFTVVIRQSQHGLAEEVVLWQSTARDGSEKSLDLDGLGLECFKNKTRITDIRHLN